MYVPSSLHITFFQPTFYMHLSVCSTRCALPNIFIFLDWIFLLTSSKQDTLWNPSLCNILPSPAAPSTWRPNIVPRALIWKLSLYIPSSGGEIKFRPHVKLPELRHLTLKLLASLLAACWNNRPPDFPLAGSNYSTQYLILARAVGPQAGKEMDIFGWEAACGVQ
jgi:hypothetical protein